MADHEATADVLDDAADYIEKHGWGIGTAALRAENGVCIEGALCRVQGIPLFDWTAGQTMPAYLALQATIGINGWLWGWNDDDGRTEQEVLDALRAAAKAERRLADGAL